MARSIRGRSVTKPSGQLEQLAKIRAKDSLVLSKIEEYLLLRKPEDRRQDIIHPSEMAKSDWCPRQTFIRITTGKQEDRRFNLQMASMFQEGNLIHEKWQRWMNEAGLLWGTWKCWCDRHKTWTGTSSKTCPTCNTTVGIGYCEVPLSAEEEFMIAGHADGAVWSLETMMEFKSIGIGTLRFEAPTLLKEHEVETVSGQKIYDVEGLWKGIKRPFNSHLKQGQIYLRLAHLMGLPFTKMDFIYEHKYNQAIKEFTVSYDPEFTDKLFDYALDIKHAIDNNRGESTVPCLCKDNGPCNKERNEQNNSAETTVSSVRTPKVSGSTEEISEIQSGSTEEANRRDAKPTRGNRSIRRRANEPVRNDGIVGGLPKRTLGSSRN
jgi:hypothetical protein